MCFDQRVSQFNQKELELNKLEKQLQEKIDAKVVELEKIAAIERKTELSKELFKQVEQSIESRSHSIY